MDSQAQSESSEGVGQLTASSMVLDALYAIWIVLLVWLIMELMFTMVPLLLIRCGRAACTHVHSCNHVPVMCVL